MTAKIQMCRQETHLTMFGTVARLRARCPQLIFQIYYVNLARIPAQVKTSISSPLTNM